MRYAPVQATTWSPVLPPVLRPKGMICSRPGSAGAPTAELRRGRRSISLSGLRSPACAPASSMNTSATRASVGPRGGAGGAALGLPLAPLKSRALRDWETRVARKGDVPCGARAAKAGGDPPCLVELRMPAGSAEPRLRAQLQPRSIRRPVRHETQNMPLRWPRPQPASCRPLSQLRPTPVAAAPGTPPPPKTPGRFRRPG